MPHRLTTRSRMLWPVAAALAATVAPRTLRPAAAQDRLSIATGGTGGVYYPLGGGLATILGRAIPGTEANVEVTPGSVDNMFLIGDKKADLAFTQADAAWDAHEGQDRFRNGKIPVRALAAVYTNFVHIVTVEGTGINAIPDLRGKRVSVGAAGSATEVLGNRVVETYGLDPNRDFPRERLSVAESVNAIKDRKIDAFFWVGGLPTGSVLDLATTPNVRMKMLPHGEAVEKMNAKYGPLYRSVPVPANTYPGQTEPVQVAGVTNLIVNNEAMSEDLTYAITRVLFERKDDFAAAHPEGKNLSLETATQGSPIPFHPGAIRYYREMGVWRG
jgi:uncharacterized protein